MKKIFLSLMLLATLSISAQEINLTENGAYEKKEVVVVDSVKASILFGRAMEALSDWTGTDGRSRAGLDYHDKESGTVIYKGTFSLGFKNVFLGDGWERYADFTLKVRCKDGRAQVTMNVPSITAIYNRNGMKMSPSTAAWVKAVKESKGKKRERGEALLENMTSTADAIVAAMATRLKNANTDDDF